MTDPVQDHPAPAARGTVRKIVLHPDERLRATCDLAADMDWPALRELADDLLATMYAAGGRGLAAPQIGVARRAFVMDAGWKDGTPNPRVVLDPQVAWRSDAVETATEQCLSIPGQPAAVSRPTAVRVAWFDLDGTAHLDEWTGIDARIAQHEMDHLDGILICDDRPAQA